MIIDFKLEYNINANMDFYLFSLETEIFYGVYTIVFVNGEGSFDTDDYEELTNIGNFVFGKLAGFFFDDPNYTYMNLRVSEVSDSHFLVSFLLLCSITIVFNGIPLVYNFFNNLTIDSELAGSYVFNDCLGTNDSFFIKTNEHNVNFLFGEVYTISNVTVYDMSGKNTYGDTYNLSQPVTFTVNETTNLININLI